MKIQDLMVWTPCHEPWSDGDCHAGQFGRRGACPAVGSWPEPDASEDDVMYDSSEDLQGYSSDENDNGSSAVVDKACQGPLNSKLLNPHTWNLT